jgi:hypothetical protein
MPIVVDVEEIHTPEYEHTTFHVEEEKEPKQEPELARRGRRMDKI